MPAPVPQGDALRFEKTKVDSGTCALVAIGNAPDAPAVFASATDWHPLIQSILSNPERLPGFQSLKHARAAWVFRCRAGSAERTTPVVCKGSRCERMADRWRDALRGSRERRDFFRARLLSDMGVPTAKPLALIERRSPMRESWLITEDLPFLIDLDAALTRMMHGDRREFASFKHGLAKQVATMIAHIQSHGWTHRDLKASNIVLLDGLANRTEPRVGIVDLQGLRRKFGRRSTKWQPLVRLAASLAQHPAVTYADRLRTLHEYMTLTGQDEADWRPCFRMIQTRVVAYQRAARERKAGRLDRA